MPANELERLASLDPSFRPSVDRLLARLRGLGFRPKILHAWYPFGLVPRAPFSFHNATTIDGVPAALAIDVVDEDKGDTFAAVLEREALLLALVTKADHPGHVQLLTDAQLPGVRLRSRC
jgi:hypothetical protein